MKRATLYLFIAIGIISLYSFNFITANPTIPTLPGRINSEEVCWVQFGSTDVFFYMTPEKHELAKKIVSQINNEKLKLTVDINDYDCFTTEISAIASKYPNPIAYKDNRPIFADPIGHAVLESYSESLKNIIRNKLGLNLEGTSREINFVLSQDAHKFHQDQSGIQFEFLKNKNTSSPPRKIIQDLTLIDWDMSVDTFSATILQDSLSKDRFLLSLFPKEIVGMLFMQSPLYLTREAHPSYTAPTIFPYHAVLSPIDKKGDSTPGSSKGKRLSTVLRAVVCESEINELKRKASLLPINRAVPFDTENGVDFIYPNGIISKELPTEIQSLLKDWNREEGVVRKYPDKENVEIYEIAHPNVFYLSRFIGDAFSISSRNISKAAFIRLVKKDGGFSNFKSLGLEISDNTEVFIFNSSQLPFGYDYFNLAEDCAEQCLPWIQLYHIPPEKVFWIPSTVVPKLSLTPVEEILFRLAEHDSKKTDGLTSSKKIITKIDLLILERSKN